MLLSNTCGGYSFLKGASPYSGGVVAAGDFTIEHVRLLRPLPWKTGFERMDEYLRAAGRPRQALCAIALRSPKPFSFAGFGEFNGEYQKLLASWDIPVDGINPVARTNVAPESDPPAEPSLYSFACTLPASGAAQSFVVSGAGEVQGSTDPRNVIRAGETSPDAMKAKASFVLGVMDTRLRGLGVGWDDVTHTNVYTVHDVNALLAAEILPRMGRAGGHGIAWHYARPPIVSIEYEMDLRGCAREVAIR